jgi:hypothetical protein
MSEAEFDDEEAALARQANLERYSLRAQAGLPLFEAPSQAAVERREVRS